MMMNRILYILFVLMTSVVNAQVGINNSKPNPFAILDMKSTEKGVLFPRVSTSQRFAIKTACGVTCPNGLLVYDTDIQAFFYMVSNNWYMLNPFVAPDIIKDTSESLNSNTTIVQNVGIGVVPNASNKLEVNGKVQVSGKTNLKNNLSVNHGVTINNGNLLVQNQHVAVNSGNTNATSSTSTITANNFSTDNSQSGNGVAPKGAIIIWSGAVNKIPNGWGLCDGTKGTPDLRGKFVVGHASTDNTTVPSTSYTLRATGGADSVQLSVNNLPSHTHTATLSTAGNHSHKYRGYETPVYYTCAGSDDFDVLNRGGGGGTSLYGGEAAGSHSHILTLENVGGNAKHENRPYFYALAYIMKL